MEWGHFWKLMLQLGITGFVLTLIVFVASAAYAAAREGLKDEESK